MSSMLAFSSVTASLGPSAPPLSSRRKARRQLARGKSLVPQPWPQRRSTPAAWDRSPWQRFAAELLRWGCTAPRQCPRWLPEPPPEGRRWQEPVPAKDRERCGQCRCPRSPAMPRSDPGQAGEAEGTRPLHPPPRPGPLPRGSGPPPPAHRGPGPPPGPANRYTYSAWSRTGRGRGSS